MRTILEELYDGRIFPVELIVPQDPEYRRLNQKISGIKETWRHQLSADDYGSLEKILELQCQSSVLEASASFGYGFKLGALLMLEVLGGREELVRRGE
jgi:hypothetical protein